MKCISVSEHFSTSERLLYYLSFPCLQIVSTSWLDLLFFRIFWTRYDHSKRPFPNFQFRIPTPDSSAQNSTCTQQPFFLRLLTLAVYAPNTLCSLFWHPNMSLNFLFSKYDAYQNFQRKPAVVDFPFITLRTEAGSHIERSTPWAKCHDFATSTPTEPQSVRKCSHCRQRHDRHMCHYTRGRIECLWSFMNYTQFVAKIKM